LLILGLTEWIPFAWRVKSVGVLALSFLALSLYGVAGVLAPAYAPPPIYTSLDDITISHPTMIDYPGLARLVGYDLNPESAVPGQSIAVTLYWQVTDDIDEDYSLFVNLVNAEGTRVGGRDTLAGLGRYSTSLWQPGQIIADTIPLPLTTATSGPTGLRLDIGWRGSDGKRLLTADGEATATIGLVRLAAAEPVTAVGNPITYHFGDMIDLVAMTPLPDVVSPGDTLQLTMTWQTRQTPDRDYTVFIHLLDQSGELVTQFDRPPLNGAFPTHLWQPGDVVVDTRQLPLPADLGGGTYRALVGWYRLEDLTRLPARNGAGEPVPGNAIPLFTLTVEQP
jgi:hypothetical protein